MEKLKHISARHWWLIPLGIFLSSRIVTTILMVVASRAQYYKTTNPLKETQGQANYFDLIFNWDGYWYYTIATKNYPSEIPYHSDGNVEQNAWAFYPLWGKSFGWLSQITGLPLAFTATALAMVFALVGILFLYRALEKHSSRKHAVTLALWMSFVPVSAIFQIGYTESLALLLIGAIFWCVLDEKYYWALIPITLLALTRPISIVVALALAGLWIHKYIQARKENSKFELKEKKALGFATFYAGLSFGLWPLICAIFTKDINGYLKTQSAWLEYSAGNVIQFHLHHGLARPYVTLYCLLFFTIVFYAVKTVKWPVFFKIWATVYILFLTLTIPIMFYTDGDNRFEFEEYAKDFIFNSSMFRYYLLSIVPLIPIASVEKIANKTGRALAYTLIAIIALYLMWFYIRYAMTQSTLFLFP